MTSRKNEAKWIENRSRWQINVQKDGERKTFSSPIEGTKGKIQAEKKADEWLASKYNASNIRLASLWADFLADLKLNCGGAHYKKTEQLGRLYILPELQHKKVSAITVQDWQNCINKAYKKGLSKKTCENIRGAVTAFYRYAKKGRLKMEKPEDLTIPKDAPVGERHILQPEDIKTLFSVDYISKYNKQIPCHYIHAWRFIVATGLRRGELCGLRKEDIQGNAVKVCRSVNSLGEITKGKNDNANRWFMLCQLSQKILQEQQAMLKAKGIVSPWVFPDEQGELTDPNHLYKTWHTYRKQHGLKSSLHEIRHTHISVAKADVPAPLLKQAVGHSSKMDTFGIYGHEVEVGLQRLADTMDHVFSRILE